MTLFYAHTVSGALLAPVASPAPTPTAWAFAPQPISQSLASADVDDEEPPTLWSSLRERESLTGEWGGTRTHLHDRGVELEAVYTLDAWANTKGGLRRKRRTLDNLDLILTVDAQQAIGWEGLALQFYGLRNHGGSPSADVGDAQAVSNIDALNTFKLYEAWADQSWNNGRMSLRAGLYDLNSEFYVTDSSSLFLQSGFGIGTDFAQTGRNGPSIFPRTSLGARFRNEPLPDWYVLAAVLDGVPGDPFHHRDTEIRVEAGDGFLVVAEAGRKESPGTADQRLASKYAIGLWGYTARFDDLTRIEPSGQPEERRGNFGLYALGEQQVFAEHEDPEQGWWVFARVGHAHARFQTFAWAVAAGVSVRGPLPGRDDDEAGIGFSTAFTGRPGRDSLREPGVRPSTHETAIEASYRLQVAPWVSVQPSVQYVLDPGADRSTPNALAAALRVTLSF